MESSAASSEGSPRFSSAARIALAVLFAGVLLLAGVFAYSRIARGTWLVTGPANRIDLNNGRRFYLDHDESPRPVESPDLSAFVSTGTPVWPDRAWYVEAGDYPIGVVAQTRDGRYWSYTLSGGW
ncbi:MAG TPA: hypothetical protein DCP20_01330 [Coriobacteriia bacterium]|nr:hypothetical protein [Coriobacteriia bacterium]